MKTAESDHIKGKKIQVSQPRDHLSRVAEFKRRKGKGAITSATASTQGSDVEDVGLGAEVETPGVRGIQDIVFDLETRGELHTAQQLVAAGSGAG